MFSTAPAHSSAEDSPLTGLSCIPCCVFTSFHEDKKRIKVERLILICTSLLGGIAAGVSWLWELPGRYFRWVVMASSSFPSTKPAGILPLQPLHQQWEAGVLSSLDSCSACGVTSHKHFICAAGTWSRLHLGLCKLSIAKWLYHAAVSPTFMDGWSCPCPGSLPHWAGLLEAAQKGHAEVSAVPRFQTLGFTLVAAEPSEHPTQLPHFRSNHACRFIFLLFPILIPPVSVNQKARVKYSNYYHYKPIFLLICGSAPQVPLWWTQ